MQTNESLRKATEAGISCIAAGLSTGEPMTQAICVEKSIELAGQLVGADSSQRDAGNIQYVEAG